MTRLIGLHRCKLQSPAGRGLWWILLAGRFCLCLCVTRDRAGAPASSRVGADFFFPRASFCDGAGRADNF